MGHVLEHKHLVVNATIKTPPLEKDLPFMKEWFTELIQDIGMNILMGPYLVYSNMEHNRGFTGVAIIETSHIALHCWDECNPAKIKLDVYTCSTLDIETIFEKLKVFAPIDVEYLFIDRDESISILKNGALAFAYENA
jgi:S-adenosylmethionine/arginine decarboxylase-like enzyme